jgi:hypothetical protein
LNLAALRVYVRDLTGVYSTDLVSDSLLDRWVNESLRELARLEKWPWAVADLVAGTDTPTFEEQFHSILAYRTAVKVLSTQADDTKRPEAYGSEYAGLLAAMRQEYFPKLAAATVGTRGQLRDYVRDITGVQSDRVSDATLNQWLQEAYQTVARQRSWDWLEHTVSLTDVSTVGPHALGYAYPRVLSVQLIDPRGVVEEVFERADTVNVNSNRRIAYYDVDDAAGTITLAPSERFDGTDTYTLRVRFSRQSVSFADDSSTPAFDPQFNPLLAYLTSARVMRLVAVETPERAESFDAMAAEMFADLVSFYELSHDDTAFQMGAEGRELQQYPYWFRRV